MPVRFEHSTLKVKNKKKLISHRADYTKPFLVPFIFTAVIAYLILLEQNLHIFPVSPFTQGLILLSGLAVFLVPIINALTEYEAFTSTSAFVYYIGYYSSYPRWSAQRFTTQSSPAHTVASVEIYLGSITGNPGTLTVNVETDNGSGTAPSGSLAGGTATGTLAQASVTANAWNTISITETSLSTSTYYWVVCSAAASSGSNYYNWYGVGSGGTNCAYYSYNSGSSWTLIGGNEEFSYEIWGNPASSPVSASGSVGLANSGTASVASGTVSASGTVGLAFAGLGSATSGTVSAPGAVGLSVSGVGTATSGTVSASGTVGLANTGSASVNSGTVNASGSVGLQESGTASATSGTIAASGSIGLSLAGTTAVTSGTVPASGTVGLSTTGSTSVNSGTVNASGTVGLSATGTAIISGLGAVNASGTIGLAWDGTTNTTVNALVAVNASGTVGLTFDGSQTSSQLSPVPSGTGGGAGKPRRWPRKGESEKDDFDSVAEALIKYLDAKRRAYVS